MSRRGAVNFCLCFLSRLKGDDGFAAQAFHLTPAEPLILECLDALKVGCNDLKLQAGAPRVEDQDVHGVSLSNESSEKAAPILTEWREKRKPRAAEPA